MGFGTNGRDPVTAVIVISGKVLSNPIIKFSITLKKCIVKTVNEIQICPNLLRWYIMITCLSLSSFCCTKCFICFIK